MTAETSRKHSIFLGRPLVSTFSRISAKAIDLVLILIIYFIGGAISPWFGVISSVVFCAVQDSLGVGQSIGKRMMGIQVLEEPHNLTCGLQASIVRNFPFMLLVFFGLIGALRFLCVVIAIPVVILEVYLIFSLDTGTRLGDVLANTFVGEYDPARPL